jgi:hypothetical protein
MTPVTISKTGTGRSSIIASDSFQSPFNVGLAVTISGSATYNIEISMTTPLLELPPSGLHHLASRP